MARPTKANGEHVAPHFNRWGANPKNSMLGELTDLGRQSTYRYGQSLRKLYVEKLGFLPDMITQNDLVYFRSTNMPRTIEVSY